MSSDVLSTASKPRLEDRGNLQVYTIKDDSKKKKKAANGSSTTKESRTVTSLSAAIPGSRKKRKRLSPFRIKTGCVVALRVGENSSLQLSWIEKLDNGVSLSNGHGDAEVNGDATQQRQTRTIDFAAAGYVNVWTSPRTARDCYLALIGKRIRCSFPKGAGALQRTVLEGEVVRHLGAIAARDATSSPNAVAEQKIHGDTANSNTDPPFQVELLVDKEMLEYFPLLKRTDKNVNLSQLKKSAQRSYQLEERIGGANKATVVVTLLHPSSHQNRTNLETGLKWVVQKRVPSKLFHKSTKRTPIATKNGDGNRNDAHSEDDTNAVTISGSEAAIEKQSGNTTDAASIKKKRERVSVDDLSSAGLPVKKRRASTGGNNGASSAAAIVTRHVGDGNDSAEQQIANWRWLAGRYHDMILVSSEDSPVDSAGAEVLSAGFIGQVLKVDPGASPSNTLAMVTLRRLYLPEHTATGRLQHHGSNHVFTDYDSRMRGRDIQIDVPIEQLVIVGRKLHANANGKWEVAADDVVAPYAYSYTQNQYLPVPHQDVAETQPACVFSESETAVPGYRSCHRCGRPQLSDDITECTSDECPLAPPGCLDPIGWCKQCLTALSLTTGRLKEGDSSDLPCCQGICDCRSCVSFAGSDLQDNLFAALVEAAEKSKKSTEGSSQPNTMLFAASVLRSTAPIDFGLPHDFVDVITVSIPQAKPSTRVKSRTPKKPRRTTSPTSGTLARTPARKSTEKRSAPKNDDEESIMKKEDYSVFKPTCAREIVYDPSKQGSFNALSDAYWSTKAEKPRNLRDAQERSTRLITEKKDDNAKASSSSRAARVNQRRLMKDVASLGATSLGLVDALANREPQLRFDRSGIHAWGVFADAAISAGEMIVEYRGELIGNAVAERREIEYEAAKIGSDYMFRIDHLNVCDATKHGNMARFINASCDPNCYTKIITLDGTKRIVIYAKKEINAGDELCYDYKFPLEYDESKRIPCHCGARECRGFMNWDKRYVVIPGTPEQCFSPDQKPLKCASDE